MPAMSSDMSAMKSDMPAMSSVISSNLKKSPQDKVVTVAGGCFWGLEYIYKMHFEDRILDTQVGFANGNVANPTYNQVCQGMTYHAEVLQISYNPGVISYKELVDFFFLVHDPTQKDRQGNDIGAQYRSAIFYLDDTEKAVAEQSLAESQKKWFPHHRIVTQVEKLSSYWDADDYHQEYLDKNPNGYHCPTHIIRKKPKSKFV
ncbi:BA75_03321T0 [Komagataella pastoris]|uniref:peptide-methionine (S)-S-oxide reductase n=1 Tax=Komagataella pastoris TaxID=4922 RepID=A0A1B2JE70_PICPA|nr:BA75_03321T0 [Komagataella pastoris]